jgi:hypothetical protein
VRTPASAVREAVQAGIMVLGRAPISQSKLVSIGHELGTATGVIDFGRAWFAGREVTSDKALR